MEQQPLHAAEPTATKTPAATLTAHQWELMNKTADVIPAITAHLYFYLLLYTVTFIDVV